MSTSLLRPPSLLRLLGAWRAQDSAEPAYRQLAQALRMLVLDGRVGLNVRLPGERELAAALGLSRTTVAAAFDRLRDEGRTIVVVSHDLDMIGWLCERTAWINRGGLAAIGPSGEVIRQFVEGVDGAGAGAGGSGGGGLLSLRGLGPDDLVRSVDLLDLNGQPLPAATSGRPVTFRVRYDAGRTGEPVIVALGLYRADGTHVSSINSGAASRAAGSDGIVEVDYHLPSLPVQPGTYELSVALHDSTMKKVFERHTHLVRFSVEPAGVDHQTGLVALGGTWQARVGEG